MSQNEQKQSSARSGHHLSAAFGSFFGTGTHHSCLMNTIGNSPSLKFWNRHPGHSPKPRARHEHRYRLMHVGNACAGLLGLAWLWRLGAPIWLLHPDIGVGVAAGTCLCQIGLATSFHPASRLRLSRVFRSSCGLLVKCVPLVAYVACASCAALVAIIYTAP
jgi:hypothetical protein